MSRFLFLLQDCKKEISIINVIVECKKFFHINSPILIRLSVSSRIKRIVIAFFSNNSVSEIYAFVILFLNQELRLDQFFPNHIERIMLISFTKLRSNFFSDRVQFETLMIRE